MKYFVSDIDSDMGILQLSEDRVVINSDGSLEYIQDGTKNKITISSDRWSTDWDKVVFISYSEFNNKISKQEQTISSLKKERKKLIAASPKLQRLTKQMKLF